jgi:hypothetical protein
MRRDMYDVSSSLALLLVLLLRQLVTAAAACSSWQYENCAAVALKQRKHV